MSQPENGKVYCLGVYVAVRSETNDWFMCVISEINDPSKEVKIRFMSKSGQYFLLSENLGKVVPKVSNISQMPYHPLAIAYLIPLMPSILKVYVIK